MAKSAFHLIEQEKEEQTGKLNFYNLGLDKIPKELLEITWLKELDLSSNKISDGSFLEKLPNLTSLDLSSNKISDYSFLEKLPNLTSLDLSGNQISDGSFLEKLPNLTSLDLNGNQISDISFLEKLPNLTSLDLSGNQISDISFLEKLPNLTSLDLSGNQISDGSFLEKLPNLTSLDLNGNQISDISFLEKLPNLISLHVANNEIRYISSFKFLKKLKTIDLENNQIENISSVLSIIKGNKLEVIMNGQIPKLGQINLNGNLISNPPLEIVKQGTDAILRYFERQKKETEKAYLYEVKVLLVGRTGAGKTSLRYKIKNPDKAMPEPDESTSGVDIETIEFEMEGGQKFRMNVWDFEGQIISHQTHQFFLTKRSQYVFVADHRTEKIDTDYWFQIVELLSASSPMVIFHNEKEGGIARLNMEAMLDRFGGFMKSESFRADLEAVGKGKKYQQQHRKSFDDFLTVLKSHLQELPIVGIQLEKSWVDTRKTVEEIAKDNATITEKELWNICEQNGVVEQIDKEDLSQLFHDLGIFLHFQDKENPSLLSQIVILQNDWATKAVYKILKSELLEKEKLGRFKLSDLKKVWKQKTKKEYDYSSYAGELLQLMMKFKICYRVANTDTYIAPQLLPASPPSNYNFPLGEIMQLRYDYDFMPKGIITQLTVEMHPYIAEGQTLAWKDGFVLDHHGAIAEIVETYGKREIRIKAVGDNRRKLINDVAFVMNNINREYHFSEKIQANMMLPCTCDDCLEDSDPHFFKYRELKTYKAKGGRDYPCGKYGNIAFIESVMSIILEGNEAELVRGQKTDAALKSINRQLKRIGSDQDAILKRLNSTEQVQQLEQMIQDKMDAFVKELPDTNEILQKWKDLNAKSMANLDSKLKLKAKLDIYFLTLEKEFAVDLNPARDKALSTLKEMRQDLNQFRKGKLAFMDLFRESE